jgi:4-carboxymuconolactone decarboxylase
MTRIPMVEAAFEPAELRPVFDQLRATRGRVPGMYRTLAHQPKILEAHRAYFNAALDAGVLPRPFKEKIAYKVAKTLGSDYSSASHRSYALKHGVTEQDLDAILRSDYLRFDARERAALAFADSMVACRGNASDACFADLRDHFASNEIVEIIALVGIMELACTLGAAFQLQAD